MNKKFDYTIILVFVWTCVVVGFGILYSISYLGRATERSGIHSSILGLVAPGFLCVLLALKSLQKRIEDLEKKIKGGTG